MVWKRRRTLEAGINADVCSHRSKEITNNNFGFLVLYVLVNVCECSLQVELLVGLHITF